MAPSRPHGANPSCMDAPFIYPINVDELTEEWLLERLGVANPNLRFTSARQASIIWGTATKVFFQLEYSHDGSESNENASICVKGNFSEKMRNYYDLGVLYTTEAAFYRDIAPQLDITLPRCWLAVEDGVDGIVALADLSKQGVTFGQASDTWSADEASMILRSLAQLHAYCWGWDPQRLPWLTLGSSGQRQGLPAMIAGDRYATLTTRPEVAPFMPANLALRETVEAALRELWRVDDLSDELTVCHGDAHLGQTYVCEDGRRGLLDWQSVAITPWAKDVAYFIGGALNVADRRACERDLLEFYLKALRSAGGPQIDSASAWKQYRRQMLTGIVWPVVIEDMQPMAAIATMSERYLTALDDLDTLGAIRD